MSRESLAAAADTTTSMSGSSAAIAPQHAACMKPSLRPATAWPTTAPTSRCVTGSMARGRPLGLGLRRSQRLVDDEQIGQQRAQMDRSVQVVDQLGADVGTRLHE